jgi:metal-responsive CopG/Arc/MetJ family transcriptional regulator
MMHSLEQLQKQQVGLRLPVYLVEQIDEFTKEYNLNRTDIIIESIKSYIEKQELQKQYDEFDTACKELKEVLDDPKKADELQTLDELLDEL